jgi:ATP-dependent Clp protease protease subunit
MTAISHWSAFATQPPVRFGRQMPTQTEGMQQAKPSSTPLDVFKVTTPPSQTTSIWQMPSIEMTRGENTNSKAALSVPMDVLRYAFIQQLRYPGEGRLKLILNGPVEPVRLSTFTLHDALTLLERPLDVIVTLGVYKFGLSSLVHPNTRSFMTPNASIILQSPSSQSSGERSLSNTEIQMERWVENQINENLATQINAKADVQDRKGLLNILKARDGMKTWSSLQALHLGKKGLIDGILIGNERVITRSDLDTFLEKMKQEKKWSETDIKTFLQDVHRIHEVPSQPLADTFPEALPSPITDSAAKLKKSASSDLQLFIKKPITKTFDYGQPVKLIPHNLPKQCRVAEDSSLPSPSVVMKGERFGDTLLGKSAVFYSDKVSLQPINKVIQALKELDAESVKQNSKNHIALYLSSPGGNPVAGKSFMDALQRLRTPVDIIVSGIAASAASMHLLASATGKRLALPNASLMIHEPSMTGEVKSNEVGEDLKQEFESILRRLSEQTGRPLSDLRKDTAKDFWMSPLDALLYGKKGFIDGIIVGPKQVITRHEVMPYLIEKLGSEEAVKKAIQERLEQRRDISEELSHKFQLDNPLHNIYQTIQDVAKRGARILGEDPEFKHTGASLIAKTIEHIPVKAYDSAPSVKIRIM